MRCVVRGPRTKHCIVNQLISQMKERIEPVWMDLAYVPHHGSSSYTTSEFFKRVRARYYVFSGVDPSREVFDALIEAKKTWENKDQGQSGLVKIIIELSLFRSDHYPNIRHRRPRLLGGGERGPAGRAQDRPRALRQPLHHQLTGHY